MGESAGHIRLVESLTNWIAQNLLNGDYGHIFVYHPLECYVHPPRIGHSIPDVYVSPLKGKGVIIGEAKTSNDIDNQHTYDQMTDYLRRCVQFKDSVLVIAVAWDMVPLMETIIKQLQKNLRADNVRVELIEQLSPWDM
jgi:hypothetical protein